MKREYMKPAMRVVKIQHQHIICVSPAGYDGKSLGTHRGGSDKITDDDDDAIF